MVSDGNIKAMLEGQHQNPLAAYSTQQLREELSQRRRDHICMRLKVKLKQKVKDVFEVIENLAMEKKEERVYEAGTDGGT